MNTLTTKELERGITLALEALDRPDQPAAYYREWAEELRRLTTTLVASYRARLNTQKVLRCLALIAA